jgi:hypothetical protein
VVEALRVFADVGFFCFARGGAHLSLPTRRDADHSRKPGEKGALFIGLRELPLEFVKEITNEIDSTRSANPAGIQPQPGKPG